MKIKRIHKLKRDYLTSDTSYYLLPTILVEDQRKLCRNLFVAIIWIRFVISFDIELKYEWEK